MVLRDAPFGWYATSMFALVGLTLAGEGGRATGWPQAAVAAEAFSLAVYFAALAAFCRAFLLVGRGGRALDIITFPLLAANVVAIFGEKLLRWHGLTYLGDEILQLALLAVLAARGVLAYRQGFRPARYYLAAFAFAVTGILVNDLNLHGVLLPRYHLGRAFDIGVALEALLFALALADRNRALSALVGLDGLTGIANRRSFDAALSRTWDRARRGKGAIGLLMIDVDAFKTFNDEYGHQAGDDVLRRVASAVEAAVLRPDDVAARYGGEEFAIVLPHAELEAARVIGERVRANVRALAIAYPRSEPGIVTVSVGAAAQRPDARRDPAGLVAAADAALYRAKREGRDRVALAELESSTREGSPS